MFRKFVAVQLMFLTIWSNTCAALPANGQAEIANELGTVDYAELLLRNILILERLKSTIDRAQIDLDVLLEKLEFEHQEIIAFVRSEIAFEQYPGLLRGAKGTLLSGAGNSLDQSVLLAELMNNAGFEARIANAQLSRPQAALLLGQMAKKRPQGRALGDRRAIQVVLEEMAREMGYSSKESKDWVNNVLNPPELSEASQFKRAIRKAKEINEQLSFAGVELGSEGDWKKLVDEARDYYWVEYRVGPASNWVSVQPAFHEPTLELDDLSKLRIISGFVPAELHHRVRMQAFISQRVGAEVRTHALMSPWEAPAANLNGIPISLTNYPLGFRSDSDWKDETYDEVCSKGYGASRLFVPLINGKIPDGALAFDVHGNVIDPLAAMSNAASLFQTLGSSMVDAVDGLSAADQADMQGSEKVTSQFQLEEQWVEFTLISPAGDTRSFRRTLIKQSRERPLDPEAISQRVTFGVATGSIPEAYALDQILAELLKFKPNMSMVRASQQHEKYQLASNVRPLESRAADVVSQAVYFLLASKGNVSQNSISYLAAPALVASYEHVWVLDSSWHAFDIISNARRGVQIIGESISLSPKVNVRAGVWESYAETVAFPFTDISTTEGSTRLDPWALKPEGWSTYSTKTELAKSGLDASIISYLETEVDQGFAVLVPKYQGIGTQQISWWRVNPRNGQTLKMIRPGWGGVSTEEMTLLFKEVATAASAKVACVGVFCGTVAATAAITTASLGLFGDIATVGAVSAFVALAAKAAEMAGSTFNFMEWCVNQLFKAKWVPGC